MSEKKNKILRYFTVVYIGCQMLYYPAGFSNHKDYFLVEQLNESLEVRHERYVIDCLLPFPQVHRFVYLYDTKNNRVLATGSVFDIYAGVVKEISGNELLIEAKSNDYCPNWRNPWRVKIK